MIYIGVDPGKDGGIAMLAETGQILVATRMPDTDRDLFEVFRTAAPLTVVPALMRGDCHAFLERAQASPQMGSVSAFKYGKGFGALCMALTAAEIPFDYIAPQKWQTALGCLSGGDKNVTKARAQARWPRFHVTHALADALLIAECCRRFMAPSAAPRTVSVGKKSKGRRQSEGARPQEGRPEGESQSGPQAPEAHLAGAE